MIGAARIVHLRFGLSCPCSPAAPAGSKEESSALAEAATNSPPGAGMSYALGKVRLSLWDHVIPVMRVHPPSSFASQPVSLSRSSAVSSSSLSLPLDAGPYIILSCMLLFDCLLALFYRPVPQMPSLSNPHAPADNRLRPTAYRSSSGGSSGGKFRRAYSPWSSRARRSGPGRLRPRRLRHLQHSYRVHRTPLMFCRGRWAAPAPLL